MKNNRSIDTDSNFITQHDLSTEPPPEQSLFWKMWKACSDLAHQALETDFIQGIKNGSLSPVVYGGFNVMDAYYCFHGAEDYARAASKASDPALRAFLDKKHSGYQSYNASFSTQWHIRDAAGVIPSDTCRRYSEFETGVAAGEEPIYCLIVMIPCEYLWAWLGARLSGFATEGNLYAPWISGNNDPKGAYAMGNFLERYRHKHSIDEEKAIQLYRQAMEFEQQNFATAM